MDIDRAFVVRWALLVGALSTLALTIPRHAGPDEPAHAVRAAALARGQVLGRATAAGDARRTVEVPAWLTQPEPACFAFKPEQRAGCASVQATAGTAEVATTAASYPVFGHVVPALGTLLPGGAKSLYAARVLGAVLIAALLAAALGRLARRDDSAGVGAALLALTPAALFAMAVINPSGLTIAGAVAMTVALADLASGDASANALFALGSAALLLPRPDGAVWFSAVLVLVAIAWGLAPMRTAWRSLGRWTRAVVAVALVASVAWPLVVRPRLIEIPTEARGRALVELVLARTSMHLDEGVGVLGWADTRIPRPVFYAWWALVAVLAATAWPHHRRGVYAFTAGVAGFVSVGWIADLTGASSVGLVWQGRYALPMLVAAVLCTALRVDPATAAMARSGRWLEMAAVVLWIAAFWQAFRRWSVGASGTPFPWLWERGASLLHPLLGLLALAGAGGALLWAVRVTPGARCEQDPTG